MSTVSKDFELSTGKVLRISARKATFKRGFITVVASTHKVDGSSEVHVMFQDMYKKLLEAPCSRVTQKRLQEALAEVLDNSGWVYILKQEAEQL